MNNFPSLEQIVLVVAVCLLFALVGPGEPFYYDGPQIHLTAVKWMDKE